MEIFRLFGSVLVETSGAEQSLNKLDQKAKGSTDKIAGFISNAAKWGTAIAGTLAAAGTALVAQANETAAYGDMIDKQSQRLGFTAEEYQEWDHALQHYGTSLNEVGKQIYDLYQGVAEKKDGIVEALESIGITMAEADSLTPEQLFSRTITALQGIASDGTRAAVASVLFKGAAEKLNPVLNDSAENTDALKGHMHDLNALMSDEDIQNAADYADAVLELKTAWGALGNTIGAAVLSPLTELINWIAGTAIPTVREFIGLLTMQDQAKEAFVDGYTGEQATGWWGRWNQARYEDISGSFAGGISFVPYPSTTARLHYGERVLTKEQNEEYTAGKTGGSPTYVFNISSVPQTPAEIAAAAVAVMEQAVWKS